MATTQMTDAQVLQKALSAYEVSRMRLAAGFAVALALLPALSALLGTALDSVLVLGALLCVGAGVLMWRGGPFAYSAMTGLKAGLIPLAFAHIANRIGHVCTPSGCTNLCVPACAAGGVLAGALIAYFAKDTARPNLVRLAGGGVALAIGSLGCSCVGYSGVIGLVLGLGASVGLSALMPKRVR